MVGAGRISRIVLSQVRAAIASVKTKGSGLEMCNHYARAVKAFSRWLWRDGRTRMRRVVVPRSVGLSADCRTHRLSAGGRSISSLSDHREFEELGQAKDGACRCPPGSVK